MGKEFYCKANATHPWCSSDAVPLSSERSAGDSWSREGDVFPPTLSAAGTSLAGGSRCGRCSLGGSTTEGVVRTDLWQGTSNSRSNSSTSFGGNTAVDNGDKSPSAGVQPWATETKLLRREYSRGQLISKSFGGTIAVGTGEDQKSYDGSMIVARELQQQLKPRGRSITAGTHGVVRRRGYMKSRGMVMRTPRRGCLWRRSNKGAMSTHSAKGRMVEAWPFSLVTPTVQAVRG